MENLDETIKDSLRLKLMGVSETDVGIGKAKSLLRAGFL